MNTASKYLIGAASSLAATVLAGASAQAATFTPFTFQTNFTGTDAKKAITLNSVKVGSETISNFQFVDSVVVDANASALGPASVDCGDLVGCTAIEAPNAAQVKTALANNNLNYIIDTEDDGVSAFTLSFAQATDTFFFWERGGNSDFTVEALGSNGSVLTSTKVLRSPLNYAGYSIDTTEISGAQKVSSYGLKLDSAVTKIRVKTNGVADKGADWKVVASSREVTKVSEPLTFLGVLIVGGAFVGRKVKAGHA
jgi:hypothetical protein